MNTEIVHGIEYSKPTVTVLQQSPLLVAEISGRTAYDSFSNSEHEVIRNFTPDRVNELDADSSELLTSLAWVHHHHCYSNDTECLTEMGWKLINEITMDDGIITLNPTTNYIETHKPTNLFSYEHKGNMVEFKGTNIDLLVTENHKVYVADGRKKINRSQDTRKFSLVEASKVMTTHHYHTKRSNGVLTPSTRNLALLSFIGFFIGDGSIRGKCISFHLKKARKIEYLINLCEMDDNITFSKGSVDNDTYTITLSTELATELAPFYKNKEKTIPSEFITNSSKAELQALIEGYVNADGDYNLYKSKKIIEISTTSKSILNKMEQIAVLLGVGFSLTYTQNADRDVTWPDGKITKKENRKPCYAFRFITTKLDIRFNNSEKEKSPKIVPYSGTIACIEVPNHIIMVRRNNKAVWSGNSVIEHLSLSYLIKGTSRGVLQELARHRIVSYTVRSTRYTMSSVINAFVSALTKTSEDIYEWDFFRAKMLELDLFVTTDEEYNTMQILDIYKKLKYQCYCIDQDEFIGMLVAKSSLPFLKEDITAQELFDKLQQGKTKKNSGDSLKHIVNDNWKVDLVMTINLRSLQNFLQLRDSGAAYFAIQWLSAEMIKATPRKYLNLILKEDRINKHLNVNK